MQTSRVADQSCIFSVQTVKQKLVFGTVNIERSCKQTHFELNEIHELQGQTVTKRQERTTNRLPKLFSNLIFMFLQRSPNRFLTFLTCRFFSFSFKNTRQRQFALPVQSSYIAVNVEGIQRSGLNRPSQSLKRLGRFPMVDSNLLHLFIVWRGRKVLVSIQETSQYFRPEFLIQIRGNVHKNKFG